MAAEDRSKPRLLVGHHWDSEHSNLELWAYFPKTPTGEFTTLQWALCATGDPSTVGVKEIKFNSEMTALLGDLTNDRTQADIKKITDKLRETYASSRNKPAAPGGGDNGKREQGEGSPAKETNVLNNTIGNENFDDFLIHKPKSTALRDWQNGKLSALRENESLLKSIVKALRAELDVPVTDDLVLRCDDMTKGSGKLGPFHTIPMMNVVQASKAGKGIVRRKDPELTGDDSRLSILGKRKESFTKLESTLEVTRPKKVPKCSFRWLDRWHNTLDGKL